jgi:zinc transport system substrate-binding protein
MLSLVALVVLVCGCDQAPVPPSKFLVVASFYPLYDFSRQVAGERAEVVLLVPAGVEPHDWEPTPPDIVRIQRARVFVYNGAGFEPWADKVRRSLAGTNVIIVRATEGLAPAVAGSRVEDPHAWLDPVLARTQVETIRSGFAKADPAGARTYEENAHALATRLAALHQEFERGLADCVHREFVVSHAAFGHLARRYRLTMVPLMGVALEGEPTAASMASIVRFVREHRLRYILFEPLVSGRLAETIAREAGAATLVLNPIEGLTRAEAGAGKDYLALMRANLVTLRTALECT